MIKILVISVVSVLLISLLKQYKSDYSFLLKLAAITVISVLTVGFFKDSDIELSFFNDLNNASPSYLPIIVKTLGIVIVTQIASGLCRENGEESISLIVELAGKISVFIICLPLIESLYTIVKSYLEI